MRTIAVTLLIAATGSAADPVPYTAKEVAQFVDVMHGLAMAPQAPEEDAIVILADLERAHRHWDEKAGRKKVQRSIIRAITAGLSTARPLLTLECARTLGRIGTRACDAPLRAWLTLQLARRMPNPQHIEHGLIALAWVGESEGVSFLVTQTRHEDPAVAVLALRAIREIKRIPGARRRPLFAELLKGFEAEPKHRAAECLRTLGALAGREVEDVAAARKWLEQPLPDYVGPRFRRK